MIDAYTAYDGLKNHAARMGYEVQSSTFVYVREIESGGKVDHGLKVIYLMPVINEKTIVSFCHELGHCLDRQLFKHKRDRTKKAVLLWDELIAWILGFKYCVTSKVSIRLYLRIMFKSLQTYLKYGGKKR